MKQPQRAGRQAEWARDTELRQPALLNTLLTVNAIRKSPSRFSLTVGCHRNSSGRFRGTAASVRADERTRSHGVAAPDNCKNPNRGPLQQVGAYLAILQGNTVFVTGILGTRRSHGGSGSRQRLRCPLTLPNHGAAKAAL